MQLAVVDTGTCSLQLPRTRYLGFHTPPFIGTTVLIASANELVGMAVVMVSQAETIVL